MKIVDLKNQWVLWFIVGLLIGCCFFVGIYGTARINPTNDGWIYIAGGDLPQHYLGWQAYRASDWRFPFCVTDKLSYPIKTSIMFTDSVPVWAVFFKLLSPVLPQTFQYIGLFGFVTCMLQGGFGILLLRKMNCSNGISVMGTVMLSFMPTLMQRMFVHASLASQWLILAALLLWFSEEDIASRRKHLPLIGWCALMFLTVGIHLYFFVMLAVILIACNVEALLSGRQVKEVLVQLFAPFISALFGIFCFGGFVSNTAPNAGYPNYFTSNVLSMLDSFGWSSFLPNLPKVITETSEGFAYLGLGFLFLWVMIITSKWLDSLIKKIVEEVLQRTGQAASMAEKSHSFFHPREIALFFMIIVSLLMAWGSTVTFLDKVLFSWPLPDSLLKTWGIFRATGRFIWVAMYIVAVLAMAYVGKHFKKTTAFMMVFIALGLQFVDLHPFSRMSKTTTEYVSPLSSPLWRELTGYSHIYLGNGILSSDYMYPVTKFALNHHMTVNQTYFARPPLGMPTPFAEEADSLYIFGSAWEAYPRQVYAVDGLLIGATTDTSGNFFEMAAKYAMPANTDGIISFTTKTPGIVLNGGEIGADGAFYTNGKDGMALYGPYASGKPGVFTFTLNYTVLENPDDVEIAGVFDVCTQNGSHVIRQVELKTGETEAWLTDVSFESTSDLFETRVLVMNGVKIKIISVDIRGIDVP